MNDRRYKILMLWDCHAVQMKVGPYILELNKTLGARATICGGRSALAEFCQLKEGGASLTAGLGHVFGKRLLAQRYGYANKCRIKV